MATDPKNIEVSADDAYWVLYYATRNAYIDAIEVLKYRVSHSLSLAECANAAKHLGELEGKLAFLQQQNAAFVALALAGGGINPPDKGAIDKAIGLSKKLADEQKATMETDAILVALTDVAATLTKFQRNQTATI